MELLGIIIHNLAAFILIISVIVFVHEFGHYYIARRVGVKIEAFSIGFGPEIWGWNDKHGTRWKLSVLPFGGYVKMFGDMDPSSSPDQKKLAKMSKKELKQAFHAKTLPEKAAVVAAGPIANFILAIVILTFFYSHYGRPITLPVAEEVLENSAAQEAGVKQGDTFLEVDGYKIHTFEDISRSIATNLGTPVNVLIKRGEQEITIAITPRIQEREDIFGNKNKTAMIGIASRTIAYEDLAVGSAAVEAVKETWFMSAATLEAIGQMLIGERSADGLSGPIRIAKYSGQSADKGVATVLWFMAVLSLNLGLINLFPIPMLDGGHLLYYAIEAVRGKPLADKVQEWGFRVGMALVLALAVFSTFNDLKQLNVF